VTRCRLATSIRRRRQKVELISQYNNVMDETQDQLYIEPVTIEQKIEDLRRRLAQIEMYLMHMGIRGKLPK
jgi:vacuolar-type H+-ATPase subunit D/Vma8